MKKGYILLLAPRPAGEARRQDAICRDRLPIEQFRRHFRQLRPDRLDRLFQLRLAPLPHEHGTRGSENSDISVEAVLYWPSLSTQTAAEGEGSFRRPSS